MASLVAGGHEAMDGLATVVEEGQVRCQVPRCSSIEYG
jgi:hypothetical protein